MPPPLRPWMNGIEFIPFVRTLDKKGRLVDVSPPPADLFASKDASLAGGGAVYVNAGPCAASRPSRKCSRVAAPRSRLNPRDCAG